MKLLTVHRPALSCPEDFCHAIDGELAVVVSTGCTNPGCGCDRAAIGLNSARATTTVRVADLGFTEAEVVAAVVGYLEAAGWSALIPGGPQGVADYAQAMVRFAAAVAEGYPEGEVLRPRFDAARETWVFTPAGA